MLEEDVPEDALDECASAGSEQQKMLSQYRLPAIVVAHETVYTYAVLLRIRALQLQILLLITYIKQALTLRTQHISCIRFIYVHTGRRAFPYKRFRQC
jgi:hypothetical protein